MGYSSIDDMEKGFYVLSNAMLELSKLTNKEVYILNKFKRSLHSHEVWMRKIRRKKK